MKSDFNGLSSRNMPLESDFSGLRGAKMPIAPFFGAQALFAPCGILDFTACLVRVRCMSADTEINEAARLVAGGLSSGRARKESEI